MTRSFLNRGDGTFEDQSRASGLADPQAHFGLGALFANLDDDGLPDLFVANDATPNLLYKNLGGARFEEIGLLSGVAFNAHGVEQAGMGVAAGDFLNQGRLSLYVTHFSEDYNTLYRNEGHLNFSDITSRAGLDRPRSRSLAGGRSSWILTTMAGWTFSSPTDMSFPTSIRSSLRPWLPTARRASSFATCAMVGFKNSRACWLSITNNPAAERPLPISTAMGGWT